MFFPVNEIVKRQLADLSGVTVRELQPWQRLIAGACAGICYWVPTYPLDVVKGVIMSKDINEPNGWISTVKSIYSTQGMKGFSRGLLPCAARAVPACAAMFATVDLTRQILIDIS